MNEVVFERKTFNDEKEFPADIRRKGRRWSQIGFNNRCKSALKISVNQREKKKYFPQIFAEKVADDRRLVFIIRVNQRLKSL